MNTILSNSSLGIGLGDVMKKAESQPSSYDKFISSTPKGPLAEYAMRAAESNAHLALSHVRDAECVVAGGRWEACFCTFGAH